MNKVNAQEMLERLRKKHPDLNIQLGKSEDYETSIVFVEFFPQRPQGGIKDREPSASGFGQGGNRSAARRIPSEPQKQGEASTVSLEKTGRRRRRKGLPGKEGK